MSNFCISIITVTYNNLGGLKKTVQSVSELMYQNFEMIIIDGASTDGTVRFLSAINHPKITWKSESDTGIYDAMNKGLEESKGDWIIFMNAGDSFYRPNILSEINFPSDPTVLYGACSIKYETGFERIMQPGAMDSFWKGLPFSHQTVLIHKDLIGEQFDTAYRFCADYALLYQLYHQQVPFLDTKLVIAYITAGGLSDQKRYLATYEVYKIGKKIKPLFRLKAYFFPKIAWSFISVKLQNLLPQSWQNKLYKIKYN